MTRRKGDLLALALAALITGCGESNSSDVAASAATSSTTAEDAGAEEAADAGEPRQKRRRFPQVRPIKNALPAPSNVSAPPAEAEKTDSGLASVVLEKGRGRRHPGRYDAVTVHYSGWTTEGINFDSSVVKGEPSQFRLNQVIKGWKEGLRLMVKGEKRRFWVPEELAYKGRRGRPQGMLVFDVELLDVDPAPPLPDAPEDVAAPPEDAERTDSGLASKVLREGRGENPGPTSKVKINYTAWTTDGEVFRSTILDGRPSIMPLNRISSKGLAEGLQLMKRGEKRRLWIPAELAYKNSPSGPDGMVVMDIEMLKILD